MLVTAEDDVNTPELVLCQAKDGQLSRLRFTKIYLWANNSEAAIVERIRVHH